MLAQDGYVAVKKALGEGSAFMFDDPTIIKNLNWSAREMCRKAQCLTDTYRTVTALAPAAAKGAYYQEYAMPADCQTIIGVRMKVNIVFDIKMSASRNLQEGAFVQGVPRAGWIRRGQELAQQIPGNDIIILPIPGQQGKSLPWIVGLHPVPVAVYPMYVDYIQYHPEMINPLDPCLIPDTADYIDIWTSYAKARGFEAIGDSALKREYDEFFRDGCERFKNDMFMDGAQTQQPTWGGGEINDSGLSITIQTPSASDLTIDL